MNVKILEKVAIRTSASWASQAVRELQVGEQVDLGTTVKGEGGDWVVTTLPDGRVGYLPGNAKVYRIRNVKVAQARVDIYAAPVMGSAVIAACKSGDSLTLMGIAGDGNNQWVEVRTPTGQTGFIMPGTKIKETGGGASPEARQQMAKKNMVVGALWCVGGTVVTVATFSVASSGSGGGHYFIAWGAIIFGGIQFFKGLIQYFT